MALDVNTPLKGELDPDILEEDLNENVREGAEARRFESLRLKMEEKGMFADFKDLLGGGSEAGEHNELSRINGMANTQETISE